jgi:hypothetical protein
VNEAERKAWADACNQFDWACMGKDKFTSPSMAQKVLDKMRRAKKRSGTMNIYRCKFCHTWHIGSSN